MKQRVVVIGLGIFGMNLVRELCASGVEVIAIDKSKEAIQKSAGYAVFSNFGMKIFFAGGGSGKGIAVNNATKKETFMKMIELQAGLGFGVKKFSLVWVFETPAALGRRSFDASAGNASSSRGPSPSRASRHDVRARGLPKTGQSRDRARRLTQRARRANCREKAAEPAEETK